MIRCGPRQTQDYLTNKRRLNGRAIQRTSINTPLSIFYLLIRTQRASQFLRLRYLQFGELISISLFLSSNHDNALLPLFLKHDAIFVDCSGFMRHCVPPLKCLSERLSTHRERLCRQSTGWMRDATRFRKARSCGLAGRWPAAKS